MLLVRKSFSREIDRLDWLNRTIPDFRIILFHKRVALYKQDDEIFTGIGDVN